MTRFTLQPRRWYACLFLGDEFDATDMCYLSPSPIHIEDVKPHGSGKQTFELRFFHTNCPEGVQGKPYTLETIERGKKMILARSTEHNRQRIPDQGTN